MSRFSPKSMEEPKSNSERESCLADRMGASEWSLDSGTTITLTFLVAEPGSERSRNGGRVVSSGRVRPSTERLAASGGVAGGRYPLEPRRAYSADPRRDSASRRMSAPAKGGTPHLASRTLTALPLATT